MEHELHDRHDEHDGHHSLDDLMREPYPLYARARAAEGLVRVPELDAWLVARDADVREVLRRGEEFSSANALRPDVMPSPAALAVLGDGFGGRPVVVTSDGERHRRLRAPLLRALSPRHLAFGFGAHACVGAQLAREQLRVTVTELTRRLPRLRLADGRPVTMRPTMIHRSPEELHLAWAVS
ncbi:cytochrome P450 [Streptomyces sp. NPDC094038]|uniref:cytochrome P450 n=1 Tax=Streptomyces sp. NPDC094038 TaxID=3366055 RepID=UPI0038051565